MSCADGEKLNGANWFKKALKNCENEFAQVVDWIRVIITMDGAVNNF